MISRHDRTTDAPLSMDLSASTSRGDGKLQVTHRTRLPWAWLGMGGYLAAGVVLGLILIVALSIGRGGDDASAAQTNLVTDPIVHLHARDIGHTCWEGLGRLGPARLTVALEVGVDGKIRYAAASGETAPMRGCVEAHVKSWEFLPQMQAQTMALPFEVDRR